MNATTIMKEEHVIIKRVLRCLIAATDQAEKGGVLDAGSIRKMIEFFRGFADRCHHGKEEARFFPVARQRGVGCVPGDMTILLAEHEQGRNHVRAMDENLSAVEKGDGRAKALLYQHARQFERLLTEHIRKEDDCLFPNADAMLSSVDQDELVRDFEKMEREEMGAGTHERFHALADELCAKWKVLMPAGSIRHG